MDLSNLDIKETAAQGAKMELKHPASGVVINKDTDPGKGEPITITLTGRDAKEYQGLAHRLQNKKLANVSKAGKMKLTAEELEDDELGLLVLSTKGWDGIVIDGQPVPFTPEAAKTLYLRFPWIREQASEFVADRSNFLGNS